MKASRKIKVYSGSDRKYRSIPQIKFQGKWLKKFGFTEGTNLNIACQKGKLIITAVEPEAV